VIISSHLRKTPDLCGFPHYQVRGDFFPVSVIRSIFSRSEAMNKNELIAEIADAADITKAKASDAVDAFIDAITGALASGDEVRLVGFGTFAVAQRKATEGRNPRTGAVIKISASKQPKFKAGKALKDAVNAGKKRKAA
jgi:DNA-binding protein HU-beta